MALSSEGMNWTPALEDAVRREYAACADMVRLPDDDPGLKHRTILLTKKTGRVTSTWFCNRHTDHARAIAAGRHPIGTVWTRNAHGQTLEDVIKNAREVMD